MWPGAGRGSWLAARDCNWDAQASSSTCTSVCDAMWWDDAMHWDAQASIYQPAWVGFIVKSDALH